VKTPTALRPLLAATALLALAGCDYDFPATAAASRPVDEKLLGDWVSHDKDEPKDLAMHVRKFDASTYVVSIESDIYRAFHSDLGKNSLLSVQDLNGSERKYVIYAWKLSSDGTQLTLRRVATDVIPESTKDAATFRDLLEKNSANPKLFTQDLQFTRAVKN
jgi:hypothetical protein